MNEQSRNEVFFQVFNEIAIVQQLAASEFNRYLPDGIHISHFGVINHLFRLGDGRTPARIAKAFQVTKPTMSHTLNILSARDFVELRANPKDGRSKLVFLTDKGRDFRNRALQSLKVPFDNIADNLDAGKVAEILPQLREIREFLDKARDE